MKKSTLLHRLAMLVVMVFALPALAVNDAYYHDGGKDGWYGWDGYDDSSCDGPYCDDGWSDDSNRYRYGHEECDEGYEWSDDIGACMREYADSGCSEYYSPVDGQHRYRGEDCGDDYGTRGWDWNYYGSCEYVQNYIPEGATIRSKGGVDVFIVKYAGGKRYKRLVLNPWVFNNYEHLEWDDVRNVNPALLDCFTTSDLVRSERNGRVYKLYPSGDYGTKRLLLPSAYSRYYIDRDSIYAINGFDEDSYTTGKPLG